MPSVMSRIIFIAFITIVAITLASCGAELRGKISCTGDEACTTSDAAAISASCCGGSCVVEAVGCESGLRYLTTEPAVGTCVASAVCAVDRDMSVALPPDFAFPSHD